MGLRKNFLEKIKFVTDTTSSVEKTEKQDELRRAYKEAVDRVYDLVDKEKDLIIKIENLANGQALDDKMAKKRVLEQKSGLYRRIEEITWDSKTMELIDEIYQYMNTGKSDDDRVSKGKSLLRQLVKNNLDQKVECARALGMEIISLEHLQPDAVLSERQKKEYGDLPTYIEARKDEIEKTMAVLKSSYMAESELSDREVMLIEDKSKPVSPMLCKDESEENEWDMKISQIESKLNDAIDRAAVETYEQIKRETEILLSGKRGKNIMINTILSEENARTSEAR